MYLNVNGASGSGMGGDTPKTPEILNSLIAMSNPFDGYSGHHGSMSGSRLSPGSSDGSSLGSPLSGPSSIQHTCSQLIKEGLKLTIQTKRLAAGHSVSVSDSLTCSSDELTPEDEERRKRRRERNKIAATKCRNKKKEKTVILVQESETLEGQNISLKTEIQKLENEKRRLVDILTMHTPNCVKMCPYGGSPPGAGPGGGGNHDSFGDPSGPSGPGGHSNPLTQTQQPSHQGNPFQYTSCSFDIGNNTQPPLMGGFTGIDNSCVAL